MDDVLALYRTAPGIDILDRALVLDGTGMIGAIILVVDQLAIFKKQTVFHGISFLREQF
jgi:multisubunit Na+/H+ antiporter MnhF subunit